MWDSLPTVGDTILYTGDPELCNSTQSKPSFSQGVLLQQQTQNYDNARAGGSNSSTRTCIHNPLSHLFSLYITLHENSENSNFNSLIVPLSF